MQHRMKTHQLTAEQISRLLRECLVGCLATVGIDNTPYVTPVHFVYTDGDIYFHGLPKGQKISNIQVNPDISFNIYKMDGLLLDADGKPCDTNTEYQSVIAQRKAEIVSDIDRKRKVLNAIVDKYTPQYSGCQVPDNMVKGTAVVAVRITQLTGKYWN